MALGILAVCFTASAVALLLMATLAAADLIAACKGEPDCPPNLPRRLLFRARAGGWFTVTVTGTYWAFGLLLVVLGLLSVGAEWAKSLWLWMPLAIDLAFWCVLGAVLFVRRRVR